MVSGGMRKGAGRPPGTGKQTCPLYASSVKAGFPSLAEDYAEQHLDLNTHLISRPAATFFLRVSGDSMMNAGIFNGDLLIVDRSINATPGKVVIAAVNGELTVKRLEKTKEGMFLVTENTNYAPIKLEESDHIHIWGVVLYNIHALSEK